MIKRIINWYKKRKLVKRVCSKGKYNIIGNRAAVSLLWGSTEDDIVIGDHCMIKGQLKTCAHGKISLGNYSQIGAGSVIRAVNCVVVGNYTAISTNVIISDNNNHPVNPADRLIIRETPSGSFERSWINSDNAPIIIGENCWIGENSRICKGVTIGDGAIVAANTVVTKDVPANSIVAGNPGRIVKTDIDKSPRKFK